MWTSGTPGNPKPGVPRGTVSSKIFETNRRTIIMSNISRRDFLKTAGVMTLAVAAAGVLAGCEGNKPIDDETPIQTSVSTAVVGAYTVTLNTPTLVNVKYVDNDGNATYKKRLYVMFNIKKDGKDVLAMPKFSLDEEKENLGWKDDTAEKALKKVFGTTDAEPYKIPFKVNDAASNEGDNYYTVFEVAEDKTPAYTLIVKPDDKAKDPVKLVASIPAAVQINATDLGL